MKHEWDLLIRNAKIFDGSGSLPLQGDIAVADGRIAAQGAQLDAKRARRVMDATNLWAMPGLLDIHTHYDLELELAPGLPESVRHGTTTVVIANCSLGLAFGAQRASGPGADPIVDCFARVENMPKHVLKKAADQVDWSDSAEYLRHLDEIHLGPNVVPMIPHSMLRVETMGFKDSIARQPTGEELNEMKRLLKKGLREGYAGFSTDALPFHYLANDPNRHRKIPTQHAHFKEIKALTDVVREADRVWQATPPKDSPLQTIRNLLLTSGRLFGRPMRTTVVAALDVVTNRTIAPLGLFLAWFLNSWLIRGRFALQALAAPFKVWSDGIINPVAEEIPVLRELNQLDLEDRAGRLAILNDPEWVERFREMWDLGKTGFGPARLRRLLRLEDLAFSRSFEDMIIDVCPVAAWKGLSFAQVFNRLRRFQRDGQKDAPGDIFSTDEKEILAGFPRPIADEADFFIHLLKIFDTDMSWHTITANADAKKTRKLLMNKRLLPGFNDSGAHLTNMAFYDCNLRALKIASEGGDAETAYMVRRLSRDAAELFNLDTGTIQTGAAADLVLIDPVALAQYDGEAGVERIHRPEFEHEQLVNRSDGVVKTVLIGGRTAWENDAFTPELGRVKMGRRLAPRTGVEFPGRAVATVS